MLPKGAERFGQQPQCQDFQPDQGASHAGLKDFGSIRRVGAVEKSEKQEVAATIPSAAMSGRPNVSKILKQPNQEGKQLSSIEAVHRVGEPSFIDCYCVLAA